MVEIFGPTVQGEGVDQGSTAHFIRFGGCDFRCDWCDTPHAVLPAEVRQAPKLEVGEILERLDALNESTYQPPWIILTGGNPALHDLSTLVDALHDKGYAVAVETQGTRWRDWMADLDRICVSPKPPSSQQDYDWVDVQRFLDEGMRAKAIGFREYEWLFLKVVIFDEDDLEWVEQLRRQLSDALLYLSAGNDAGRTVGNPTRQDERTVDEVRRDLLEKSKWLVEESFHRESLVAHDVVIQSQYHVLIWGNELGR